MDCCQVLRIDPRAEAIVRAVGERNGLFRLVIGKDGEDRSEDFLAGNCHIRGDVAEDRRFDKMPGQAVMLAAAGYGFRPGLRSREAHSLDLVGLRC